MVEKDSWVENMIREMAHCRHIHKEKESKRKKGGKSSNFQEGEEEKHWTEDGEECVYST